MSELTRAEMIDAVVKFLRDEYDCPTDIGRRHAQILRSRWISQHVPTYLQGEISDAAARFLGHKEGEK